VSDFICVCGNEAFLNQDGNLHCYRCLWSSGQLRILVRVGEGEERWVPLAELLEVIR
jgi:hypothetical protein